VFKYAGAKINYSQAKAKVAKMQDEVDVFVTQSKTPSNAKGVSRDRLYERAKARLNAAKAGAAKWKKECERKAEKKELEGKVVINILGTKLLQSIT
jgi:hypothetical protein